LSLSKGPMRFDIEGKPQVASSKPLKVRFWEDLTESRRKRDVY